METMRRRFITNSGIAFGIAFILLLFQQFILAVILAVITLIYFFYKVGEYRILYKEEVTKKAVSTYFDDVVYEPDNGISEDIIYDTQLVSRGTSFRSEDYIKGKYKDLDIQMSDVKITRTQRVGKTTVTINIFTGQWIILKSLKDIDGRLIVVDRNHGYTDINTFFGAKERLNKIEMESVSFNEEFKVWAKDPHEAFYVLTPQFLERFLDVYNKDVSMFQEGNVLHLAILSQRNILEPKIFSKVSIEEDIERYHEELKYITDILDIIIEK